MGFYSKLLEGFKGGVTWLGLVFKRSAYYVDSRGLVLWEQRWASHKLLPSSETPTFFPRSCLGGVGC